MPSLRARLLGGLLRLSGRRRVFASEDVSPAALAGSRPASPPRAMRRRVTSEVFEGCDVHTVTPRGSSRGTVIYLHGGAYVAPITAFHWRFIARMADRLEMTFLVPLYPRAPDHTCVEANRFALSVYRKLLQTVPALRVIVMGDSAGGGLALSLAMQAGAHGVPVPGGLVLLSPWLDVTMSDPAQGEIEPRDVMLMRPGARAAGRWYAGSLPPTDPRASPLFGSTEGLPPILMVCGSHDILVTDARRFAARAGPGLAYHEEPGLMHVYAILSVLPEARAAQDRIAVFVGDRLHA